MSSSYTLADGTLPHATAAIKMLSQLLDKVEQSSDPESLLAARLHPTMLPLSFQFHFAADTASKMVARLEGTEPENFGSFNPNVTLEETRAKLDKAAARLASADADKIADRRSEIVTFGMGAGRSLSLKAQDYAAGYSLPNIFFHTTTAYNIMRKEGIELGKENYLTPFLEPYATS